MTTKFASKSERDERNREVRGMQKIKDNPQTWEKITQKEAFLSKLTKEKAALDAMTPPTLTDDEKTEARKREIQLTEVMVHGSPKHGIEPMASYEAQWKVRSGAVGQTSRWNKFVKDFTITKDGTIRKKMKGEQGILFEWKDLRRTLYKDLEEDYADIASIEAIRPDNDEGGSKFINYARLSFQPGKNLTPEEWNEATGHQPSEKETELYAQIETAEAPSPSRLYASNQCNATTAAGTRCKRSRKTGTHYCNLPAHAKLEVI